MDSPLKIAITGGIGCGKSMTGSVVQSLGIEVLDTDHVAHSLLQSDSEVQRRIAARFGPTVVGPEGINRAVLGQIAFADEPARRDLESILHPLIRAQTASWMSSRSGTCAVLVPLLFEVDWHSDFDFIACVACSPSIQRHRLAARGLSDAAIDQRLRSQLPVAEKMARAQAVIWTDGPPELQADQWRLILRRLKP